MLRLYMLRMLRALPIPSDAPLLVAAAGQHHRDDAERPRVKVRERQCEQAPKVVVGDDEATLEKSNDDNGKPRNGPQSSDLIAFD